MRWLSGNHRDDKFESETAPALVSGLDSNHDAALTRVWDATQPAEPSAAAWDCVWARVSEGLDRQELAPQVIPARRWRRPAIAAAIVAQAAAVLAAVVIWTSRPQPVPSTRQDVAVTQTSLDIPSGQIAILHADGSVFRTEWIEVENSTGVEGLWLLHDSAESGFAPMWQLARND